MKVIDHLRNATKPIFSLEVLPPLKGNDINRVFSTIDLLTEFDPKFINITSHRDEMVLREVGDGKYEKRVIRKRPGTVAVAGAIKHRYNITVVPHLICAGFTRSETEYALIDLNFLGIHDVLLLRGDNRHMDLLPKIVGEQNKYASELVKQVRDLNEGKFLDGTLIAPFDTKFGFGVAGYPEKHEEAPNLSTDISFLKAKVDAGAEYIITQMFFDNQKYFKFVDLCRQAGINVPILPGIKPITVMNQVNVLPQIFRTDIPEAFANELLKCKTNEAVVEVGVEWTIHQCKELMAHNVPAIHMYTMMASQSCQRVAKAIF